MAVLLEYHFNVNRFRCYAALPFTQIIDQFRVRHYLDGFRVVVIYVELWRQSVEDVWAPTHID